MATCPLPGPPLDLPSLPPCIPWDHVHLSAMLLPSTQRVSSSLVPQPLENEGGLLPRTSRPSSLSPILGLNLRRDHHVFCSKRCPYRRHKFQSTFACQSFKRRTNSTDVNQNRPRDFVCSIFLASQQVSSTHNKFFPYPGQDKFYRMNNPWTH